MLSTSSRLVFGVRKCARPTRRRLQLPSRIDWKSSSSSASVAAVDRRTHALARRAWHHVNGSAKNRRFFADPHRRACFYLDSQRRIGERRTFSHREHVVWRRSRRGEQPASVVSSRLLCCTTTSLCSSCNRAPICPPSPNISVCRTALRRPARLAIISQFLYAPIAALAALVSLQHGDFGRKMDAPGEGGAANCGRLHTVGLSTLVGDRVSERSAPRRRSAPRARRSRKQPTAERSNRRPRNASTLCIECCRIYSRNLKIVSRSIFLCPSGQVRGASE